MGIRCDQFTSTCGAAIMNFYDAGDEDNFYTRLMGFEQSCMEEADPMFFLNAIRNADCPEDMMAGDGSAAPSPPPPPPARDSLLVSPNATDGTPIHMFQHCLCL